MTKVPTKITVLIEGKDSTESAKLIKHSPVYNAAEYESEDGSRFYVDMEYLAESKSYVKIPLEVIKQLASSRQKLAEAQEFLNNQGKKNESGLILPPGFRN